MGVKEAIINYPLIIVIIMIILSLVFIMFGHIYREQVQQVLKNDLLVIPEIHMDWWSVSHFVLFMLIGFIIPGRHLEFIATGALFEMIEDFLSSDKNTQLVDCSDPKQPNGKRKIWCNGFQHDYWYGKWDDIIFNSVGYIIGSAIRKDYIGW